LSVRGLCIFIRVQEKAVLKKNEGSFIVLPPVPEYFIDRVNNGCVAHEAIMLLDRIHLNMLWPG
jgi:hypothetical protein